MLQLILDAGLLLRPCVKRLRSLHQLSAIIAADPVLSGLPAKPCNAAFPNTLLEV